MADDSRKRSQSNSAPIISVKNVTKTFPTPHGPVEVLKGITFDVKRGETVCVLGGSGGGKSTLLKIMIGAIPATSGEVWIDGENIVGMKERDLNRIRRKFGVLFQSGALLNSMTVGENVALPIEMHTKQAPETIEIMVKVKLEQVGLRAAFDLLPSEISGGMQKRAALARAIALDPKIVFYDEPSAGLDPIATAAIDELINDLKTKMGMTNVVVTHVMESVRRIADKVVMLDKGNVLLYGTLDDLLNSDDPRVRKFVNGEVDALAAESEAYSSFLQDLMV
ncbi:MAG TPA: ATP-binding cassette domain-containing protein [Planctomycetes bacterium]|nr:ATP-binding cassette domain-containing protein [Planctomycetota bacterium]